MLILDPLNYDPHVTLPVTHFNWHADLLLRRLDCIEKG